MGHKVNAKSLRLNNCWYDFSFLNKNYLAVLGNLFLRNYLIILGLAFNKIVFNINVVQSSRKIFFFFQVYELERNVPLIRVVREFEQLLKPRLKLLRKLNLYAGHLKQEIVGVFKVVRFYNCWWNNLEGEFGFRLRFRFIRNFEVLFNALRYSFYFQAFELAVRVVCYFFTFNLRRQWLFLRIVKKLMFFLGFRYARGFKRFLGFRFEVKGRIGGRMRKKKFRAIGGRLPLNTRDASIFYKAQQVMTRYGAYGFKFWFFLGFVEDLGAFFFFSFKKFRCYLQNRLAFRLNLKRRQRFLVSRQSLIV